MGRMAAVAVAVAVAVAAAVAVAVAVAQRPRAPPPSAEERGGLASARPSSPQPAALWQQRLTQARLAPGMPRCPVSARLTWRRSLGVLQRHLGLHLPNAHGRHPLRPAWSAPWVCQHAGVVANPTARHRARRRHRPRHGASRCRAPPWCTWPAPAPCLWWTPCRAGPQPRWWCCVAAT